MKQERLKEYAGAGFTTIGETENEETIVVKRYESGVVMIMAVHDHYTEQIRLKADHMDKIVELYGLPQAINATESPSIEDAAAGGGVKIENG